MKIIVALGNPGKDYEKTRHNAGFMAADRIASHYAFGAFKMEDKFEAELSMGVIAGEKIILVKPQTFMNASGRATQKVCGFFKVEAEDLIVIHDDLDIPVGEYRLSFGSRSAGHKGVQSIIDCMSTNEFHRVRIGIKVEGRVIPTEKFVLANFDKAETEKIEAVIDALPSAIEKELIK